MPYLIPITSPFILKKKELEMLNRQKVKSKEINEHFSGQIGCEPRKKWYARRY